MENEKIKLQTQIDTFQRQKKMELQLIQEKMVKNSNLMFTNPNMITNIYLIKRRLASRNWQKK